MKKLKELFKGGAAAIATTGAMISGSAFAAVPAGATDALDTAAADVGTIGWAVFAVIIAAMAFKYMRRAL